MQRPRSFYAESLSDQAGVSAPPPSSNSLQMPNVVVIPPEEEQAETPPFLYFDASKARLMSTAPDLESMDIALDVHQQIANTAPIFQRANFSEETIVMPRRVGGGSMLVQPNEWQISAAPERDLDDDVVEVVKVRKHEGVSDTGGGNGTTMARSKTFKARATQAFRSIKNVGKSRKSTMHKTSSSLDRIEHIHAKPSPAKASSTRRITSKRPSRPLSQIFQFVYDEHAQAVGIESQSPSTLQSPPASPTRSGYSSSRPASSASFYTMPGSLSSEPDDARQFSSVSSKRIKRTGSFRKRLSLLELPRLFSSSSSISSTSSSNSQTSIPSPPTPSRDVPEPVVAFQESPYLPDDQPGPNNWMVSGMNYPVDEDEDVDYGELQAPSLSMVREEDSHWDDTSLEMRLDSLHFDSLSFDPNDFTMTPFKDGHRNTGRIAVV
jgi:hypothetical protein